MLVQGITATGAEFKKGAASRAAACAGFENTQATMHAVVRRHARCAGIERAFAAWTDVFRQMTERLLVAEFFTPLFLRALAHF